MLNGLLLQITQTGKAVADTTAALVEQAGGDPAEITISMWDLALKGGWILAILALLSIVAVYIFVERYTAITKGSKEEKNFMNNIRDFIHDGRIDSAVTLCKHNDSPIARMIEKGLARIGKPLNDLNTAIENVGKLEVSRLEKNIADSEGVVILTFGQFLIGQKGVRDIAEKRRKPCLHLELRDCPTNQAISTIRKWMENHKIEVVYFTGPKPIGASKIYREVILIIKGICGVEREQEKFLGFDEEDAPQGD